MNNYVYGKPMPSAPVTARQMYQSNITLLKINTNGVVQDQRILDTFYKSIMASDKQFICIYQGLNGQLASKCKFLRIELNDR
jgi:isocitrate dehydrogenase